MNSRFNGMPSWKLSCEKGKCPSLKGIVGLSILPGGNRAATRAEKEAEKASDRKRSLTLVASTK